MATSLNPAQREHILSLLRRVDESLKNVPRILDPEAGGSPLAHRTGDATPVQVLVIADHARRLRRAVAEYLAANGLDVPEPFLSATRMARDELLACERYAAELSPALLRPFGALGTEDERCLDALIDTLRAGVGLMRAALDDNAPAQETGPAPDASIAGSTLLAQAIRIAEKYGLRNLVERGRRITAYAADSSLHVCLLGRTNAGKSSLTNCLLGADLLPVGPIPMTVTPIRVVYGSRAQATASLADARTETFEPWRLAEFASTRANAGNRRHVRELCLSTPAPLLREGLVLIDAPGVEAVAGDAAWERGLPDFDLALVVVDAESGFGAQDASLVEAARRHGGDAVVLLNKADLLPMAARWEVLGFAKRRLLEQFGEDIDVRLASTQKLDEPGADWVDAVLRPALADRHRRHARTCARKAILLCGEAVAELQYLACALSVGQSPDALAASYTNAKNRLDEAGHILDEPFPRQDIGALADAAIEEAVWNIADIHTRGANAPLDPVPLLLASQRSRARAMRLACELWGDKLRAAMTHAVNEASIALDADAMPYPFFADAPACRDACFLTAEIAETLRTALPRRPGLWPPRRRVRRIMRTVHVREVTLAALADYDGQLHRWCDSVRDCLNTALGVERERLTGAGATAPAARRAALKRDLDALLTEMQVAERLSRSAPQALSDNGRRA